MQEEPLQLPGIPEFQTAVQNDYMYNYSSADKPFKKHI
jgi:hypothetical protein